MKSLHLSGRSTTTSTVIQKFLIPIPPTPAFFILIWLLCGHLPLALTAGLGSKDMLISGTLRHSATVDTNSDEGPTSNNNSNSEIDNKTATRLGDNVFTYNCPSQCQCEYSISSQKLEVSCSSASTTLTSTTASSRLDLSPGVRLLRISHVSFPNSVSVATFVQRLPLVKNTLVELDLDQVVLDPQSFLTSSLFQESVESLRKITIKGAFLNNEEFSTAFPYGSLRDTPLRPFASLKILDSLNVCDSSPSLAGIILRAMPPVAHLRVVNNSLYELPYYDTIFPTTRHQYSIESLDLSHNHLSLIPTGLSEGLHQLRTLDASYNRIFHLQEQVFQGLTSLRKLNVSHNQIEYVDAEVFTPLRKIKIVDLSENEVVQFFEPYFANNPELEALYMANMWISGAFTSPDTALRSFMETEKLISSLSRVEKLDISGNGMRSIPETLTHAPRLLQVYMDGNKWECSCQDRWLLDWVATSQVSIGDQQRNSENMWCFQRSYHDGEILKRPFYQYLKNLTTTCTNSNIIARTPYKFYAVMGKDKQLNCHAQKPNWPKITWITPSKQRISLNYVQEENQDNKNSSSQNYSSAKYPKTQNYQQNLDHEQSVVSQPRISSDGSLHLANVTGVDYGLYLCIASYQDLNITHYVHLGMDVNVFRDVRLTSIIVGWLFSFAFLAAVLLVQLVHYILSRLGVRCAIVNTTQQTRRVRAFFDSMEQNKTTQLDWLRDNYNMQAKKIKDNCYSQLERIRESYSNQSRNLGEIRDYGTQQLHTLRDQYNDQVRKVASYSAHQLCKVRENYVFKRNQVCKFSSHQLLRLRETYKWQAQTLNKILENLPKGLNFDTCRGMGACGRTDSIYLDDMGEEFIDPHYCVDSGVYRLTHEEGQDLGVDKLEHVSLLIPPEFVKDYNFRQQTLSQSMYANHAAGEPRAGCSDIFEENEATVSRPSLFDEARALSPQLQSNDCSGNDMEISVGCALTKMEDILEVEELSDDATTNKTNSTTISTPSTATLGSSNTDSTSSDDSNLNSTFPRRDPKSDNSTYPQDQNTIITSTGNNSDNDVLTTATAEENQRDNSNSQVLTDTSCPQVTIVGAATTIDEAEGNLNSVSKV